MLYTVDVNSNLINEFKKEVKENGENLYRNCFLYRLYIFLRLVIYSLKPFYYFCIELTNIASWV